MTFRSSNVCSFSKFKNSKIKCLYSRSHITVENTLDICLSCPCNFGITVTIKIFKHEHKIILCSIWHILEPHCYRIVDKTALFYCDSWCFWIIYRSTCNLIRRSLGCRWRINRIRKFIHFDLEIISIKYNFDITII